MLLQITHSTTYRYSAPVEIQPHQLRFEPRHDGAQDTLDFRLKIFPRPAGITEQIDLEGNLVRLAWFEGAHQEFKIEAETIVETRRANPFDFLRPPAELSLGRIYSEQESESLAPYLVRESPQRATSVDQLAAEIASQTDHDPIDFLIALNQEICNRIEFKHRDQGEPLAPWKTLERGSGACRDTAVLFIDACRSVGLAARFASGYHLNPDTDQANELHGWVEVFLPNAGWRGIDPTVGIWIADEHVTVAASAHANLCAPASGAYCGQATASLDTEVTIRKIDDDMIASTIDLIREHFSHRRR